MGRRRQAVLDSHGSHTRCGIQLKQKGKVQSILKSYLKNLHNGTSVTPVNLWCLAKHE